ncbi:hypothetical protein ACTI_47280 [Actinoplanes sp. OR16]|uniref:hypothetical protein n=1 Tax=Actinoplanes sp. OR16 TaxID=946334 RepID=UPI000F6E57AF|nr:hypothetical protein [Actinoplanes sp. OR16]BBH68043.1 hypothetical protein ACTI_47280 [Actinoplanes sp. OR16]
MGDPGGRRGPALTLAAPDNTYAKAARALFAAPPPRPVTGRGVLAAVVAVLAAVVVGLLRQPGPGSLDTVWAEDGSVFLAQADADGPWSALLTSYAGYFHVVPRLLAALAAAVPAEAAAAVLAISAALTTALLAVLVFVASAAHLPSLLSRILVSAVVVVVPVAQDEVLNSIANFHWYGLYALFWVFLWSPRGRAGQVVAVATVLLVATSDILVLAFVPLALFRAARRGDRFGKVLGGALAAGLAVQLAGLLAGSSSRELAPDPVVAVAGFLLRAVPAPLVGQRWLGDDLDAGWVALAGFAWLVIAAALFAAVRRVTRPLWVLAAVAAVQSAALYLLPVLLSGVAAPRYAVAPAMLVVVALVALLQPGAGGSPVPLYALTVLLAVVAVVNLRIGNPRADGPSWSTEIDRAQATCATGGRPAALTVAPRTTPPWTVAMRCEDIE